MRDERERELDEVREAMREHDERRKEDERRRQEADEPPAEERDEAS